MHHKILLSTLNWGLGHTTRSIPLIKALLAEEVEVVLASDGQAGALMRKEFPQLTYYELPSYHISYPTRSFSYNISRLVWKIYRAVKNEHKVLEKIVDKEGLTAVISDNRYGMYSNKVRSVFISHQLKLITPFAFQNPIVNGIANLWIKEYEEIWVPDFEGEPNLSGKLSHGTGHSAKFMGPLTRFDQLDIPQKYDLLILLSGPEPQRTYLENTLLSQIPLLSHHMKIALVRGVIEAEQKQEIKGNVEIWNFMTGEQLNEYVCASGLVLSRSGYSTVLDLVALGKKAFFVPTPGQTEQVFISDELMRSGMVYSVDQNDIDLVKDIPIALSYKGFDKVEKPDLRKWVRGFLDA
jgi:uncharacterized protein (TIGR00661 family)